MEEALVEVIDIECHKNKSDHSSYSFNNTLNAQILVFESWPVEVNSVVLSGINPTVDEETPVVL